MSTTLDKAAGQGMARFSNLLLMILVPASMASAFDLSSLATFPDEREVLLPPNISFKITDLDMSSKIAQIKLEFVDYAI